MNIAFIDQLITLVERSTLVNLEYSGDGIRVRLTKTATTATLLSPSIRDEAEAGMVATSALASPSTSPHATSIVVARSHTLCAGIVGTFYRASAPGQPPFVQVGDSVKDGQQIGLIDAMKMLIPVEADRAGRITSILAEDGCDVSGKTPLFQIATTEHNDV